MHAQRHDIPSHMPPVARAPRPTTGTIRPAGVADVPALKALMREGDAGPQGAANADDFTRAADELRIDANGDTLLADGSAGPLGFVQLRWGAPPPSREWMRDSVELRQQYVHSRHRGTGIAVQLLDATLRLVRQRGMGGIWLKVGKSAPAAIAFYLKCGFRIIGTTMHAEGQPSREAWVMHRRVPGPGGNGPRMVA